MSVVYTNCIPTQNNQVHFLKLGLFPSLCCFCPLFSLLNLISISLVHFVLGRNEVNRKEIPNCRNVSEVNSHATSLAKYNPIFKR